MTTTTTDLHSFSVTAQFLKLLSVNIPYTREMNKIVHFQAYVTDKPEQ